MYYPIMTQQQVLQAWEYHWWYMVIFDKNCTCVCVLQSCRRTTSCSLSSQSSWTCSSSCCTESRERASIRSWLGNLSMIPSSTWSTDTLGRWVKICLQHSHLFALCKMMQSGKLHIQLLNSQSKEEKKKKLQTNLFTHDELFSLFVLMKSHSNGVAFFPHTLLLSIFSSHYTAYPLSIQQQTFKMWRYNTITAEPRRELVFKC